MPAKIPKPTIFSMPKTHRKGSFSEKTGEKDALKASPDLKNSQDNGLSQEPGKDLTTNETPKKLFSKIKIDQITLKSI